MLREYFHEDMSIRTPLADVGSSGPTYPGSYHGIDEYMAVMDELFEAIENFQVEVRSIEEAPGGMVLVELLQSYGPENSREHQLTWVVDEIRDGKIAWAGNFASEDEARRALKRGT
jgi:hypothetical protein